MTRNKNSKRTNSPSHSTITDTSSNDGNFINLPDLSGLKDDEKQHILNVLLRDEHLRNKHLTRFMQLRKEVAELEQRPQSTSTSICARCQTPFGFIFNTGDICPKCGAKVCKQCRLMYNVNDNGWLCQLCCKQMQLMSYSGEWIYSQRSNLRKDSVTASEIVRQSLSPEISARNSNDISSSDTEVEDILNSSNRTRPLFPKMKSNPPNSYNNIKRMVVQTPIDEQRLNSIKENVQNRPNHIASPQRTHGSAFASNIPTGGGGGSSDDVDSLLDQSYTDRTSTSSIPMATTNNKKYGGRNSSAQKSNESLSNLLNQTNQKQTNKQEVDCASVTSSEWGAESERGEPSLQRHNASIKRNSKSNVSSRTPVTGSIQSLRDAVHRVPKPHLSTSRTSLNSQQKSKDEISDSTSTKASDKHDKSNSRSQLSATKNVSNSHLHESSNTLISDETQQRTKSITDSIQSANVSPQRTPAKPEAFGSVGNLDVVDSDDDIDGTFEKAKLGLKNRASSYVDIRGSQFSINSILSETKARYGLDISGVIELKLTYTLTIGALDIFISKCTNLARAKKHLTSDPYVKIYLLPDRSKNSKRKTAMKKNTIDPVFEEKFRYHVTKQEFETRVLWISVWSQASLGQNDFLGEIHIPLANCTLDKMEEYQLLAKKNKNDLTPNIEPTMDPGEIQFQLTFIENPKNKDLGTLQVHHIEAKAIYYGKTNVDAICKGLLMPDNVKRKLPNIRKGPAPKWELPLRWEGVRRDNLKNTSIEISIWCQERFRKIMLGFVRLNLAQGHFNNKSVKWLDATNAEKSAWETFLKKPSQIHQFRLPLRPALIEHK